MASSFYSNTQHIDFASVLAMNDPGMVSMFQALIASGLEGFLGCTAVVYKTALVDFFENASVCDGVIISTVAGLVEISEEWFAEMFELPVDGLADVSEMPKDKIFDARIIVSMTGEPVILSGLKSQMKIQYRLLCDIMAKSISVQAGSFNALTVEKFSLMTAVVCSVKMNWGRVLFGILKKMVTSRRQFIDIDKSGALDADVAPKATKAPKKRTAAVPADVPVEEVPIQMIEGSTAPAADDTADQPAAVDAFPADRPAEEIESVERVDEQLAAEPAVHVPAVEPAVEVSRVNVDDPETVIRQVLDQLDFVTEDPVVAKVDRVETWFDRAFDAELATADHEHHNAGTIDCGDQSVDTTNEVPWFVRPFVLANRDTKKLFETASDSEDAMDLEVESQDLLVVRDTDISTVGEQEITVFGEQLMGTNDESSEDIEAEAVEKSADEAMSIERHFHVHPSRAARSGQLKNRRISLPRWNKFSHGAGTDSTIIALQRKRYILLVYREMLFRKVLEKRRKHFIPSKGSSAVDLKILNKLSSFHRLVLEELKTETLAHGLVWTQPCCSGIFEGETRDRGVVITRSNTNTRSSCCIRTMIRVNGTWVIEPCADKWVKIPRQIISCEVHCQRQYDDTLPSSTLSEQFNESQSGISSRLHKIEQGLRDSLREQAVVFKNLFQGARQEGRTIDDVQTLRFNEFRKNILAQNASIFSGLADVRKEVQEVNAKVDIIASSLSDVRKNVEETKEALSHQLLEFQSQAQANQNILHAQLSELVKYINRGSADKKGESSSRGLQQPPNVQNLESGQSISLEETAERILEADRRQAEMERERERQRRIRRLSGSSKRRRGY
ncbi:hypothetical protein F511_38908 [Dorcoceras hygrometricum]|uniref:Dystroglycan-like n=1 Tax=Dorcoceras hygrometricum TaxID=472368 RepID=A0A2Z7AS78_9LAMI|nr:hypothetical protein F511_38908 [Dorcoceras hygrometricum]